jgi:hypothetical protein
MTANELQELLHDVLAELVMARGDEDDPLFDLAELARGVRSVRTFEEDSILTTADSGLVVDCEDGGQFRLMIVRSRAGAREGA